MMAGCIANVAFARLNEATVRVLQKNGCEVVIPAGQTCCGALHVHAGIRDQARLLARQNIDAVLGQATFDAIVTNAAGCGSTLKEYDELLRARSRICWKRREKFQSLMKDVTEFLASIELNTRNDPVESHGHLSGFLPSGAWPEDPQCAATASARHSGPAVPEMPLSDICCGSAGIYNVLHTALSMDILEKKMENVTLAHAEIIATANPGCMLQLEAGVRKWGHGERVVHVIELLDEAYRGF